MQKFLKRILIFIVIGFLIGEIVARSFVLSSDIPQRIIDNNGIQKYIPNQHGKWRGGKHTWIINNMGWPGHLPKSYDNLITIIGDSYIENFMNPLECHQSVYLKKKLPNYNFLEASRSGVSFIEAMEISKQLDTLNPQSQFIYLHDSDFKESILQISRHPDITQYNQATQKIIHGKMNSPGLKKILYNWKFLYYLYQRFPLNRVNKNTSETEQGSTISKNKKNYLVDYENLLTYISRNYNIKNKVLVFRPESSPELVKLSKDFGFESLYLQTGVNDDWSFDHDDHWTCHGHFSVAQQVASFITKLGTQIKKSN